MNYPDLVEKEDVVPARLLGEWYSDPFETFLKMRRYTAGV